MNQLSQILPDEASLIGVSESAGRGASPRGLLKEFHARESQRLVNIQLRNSFSGVYMYPRYHLQTKFTGH